MATVEVTFTPLPAHVRTARLVATAVARRSGVDESLLDEVRLAVGEACSRAVEAHRRHCPAEPVRIEMTDQDQRFVVTVSDHAPTAPARSAAPATDNGIHDAAGHDGAGHDGAGHDGAGHDGAGYEAI
ncbi:MAG TPA: ATP-binding protein, partial [Streptosporangiaceae bacterium]|nr:ATP-binding protein [Streptosporangiaceae bacterium]